MPKLYRGVWPQNVSRLAKYGIRYHEGAWAVAVLYEVGSGLRYLALDKARDDIADLVNGLKQALGSGPGGAFYVNEHRHVIVPVNSGDGTSHYYFADYLRGDFTFHFEGTLLSTRPVHPNGQVMKRGERWIGPRPGIPYVLAAGGTDIYYETPALTDSDPPTVRPMMTMKVKLSQVLANPALVRKAVGPVATIRGFEGGRFYVNEHGAMFTPIDQGDENGIDYVYCGTIDRATWFPESPTS